MCQKRRVNLAMTFNSQFVRYAYVALTSLFENAKPDNAFHIYILQSDLTDQDKGCLEELVKAYGAELEFCQVDRSIFPEALPLLDRWPVEIYYRLMLSDLVGEDVDRLLYVDPDVIFNKDVSELYFIDFEDNLLCACMEAPTTETKHKCFRLIEDKGYGYFNSGVILYNMQLYRKRYHLADYLKTAEELQYELFAPDQDLLNYLHYKEVKLVERMRYNMYAYVIPGLELDNEKVREIAVILHYAGSGKPWNGRTAHFAAEHIWWEYAKMTPFYHELLEEYMNETICNPRVLNRLLSLSERVKLLEAELKNSAELLERMAKFIKQ